MVKFGFYPSKLKKQPFFANNFTIQGSKARLPPLPTPMSSTKDDVMPSSPITKSIKGLSSRYERRSGAEASPLGGN